MKLHMPQWSAIDHGTTSSSICSPNRRVSSSSYRATWECNRYFLSFYLFSIFLLRIRKTWHTGWWWWWPDNTSEWARKKRRTFVCAIIKSDPRLFVVQCNWVQFVLPFSNMDCCTAFFTLIGVLAVANWMYSCFSSLVWITFYNILELWQPEKYSLEKRFGQWAGEKTKTK